MRNALEIVVTKGPAKGRTVPVPSSGAVTIGRAEGNTLVLADDRVAPQHLRIELSFSGVVLKELGARTGTYVGNERVFGSKKLAPGVEVRVGDTSLELRERREVTREVLLSPVASATQANLTRAQRNLTVLHQVGDLLSTERDADKFLSQTMRLICDVLHADRGVLLSVAEGGELRPRMTLSTSKSVDEPAEVSRTILAKVLDGKSVLTADAGSDPQLASGSSILAQGIRSAMCVPIRSRQKCLGAIYVDTVVSVGVFTNDDLEMLSIVGALTGTALDNIELVRENVRQERMAAIGMVVAGLGHDVRNMLAVLGCGVQMLGRTLEDPDGEDAQAAWEAVQRSQESIEGLVMDMLAYSKEREPQWGMADLNAVVERAVEFASRPAEAKEVAITKALDPTIGPFLFDARALERCAMNLLTNAIDAVEERSGQVGVQTQIDDVRRTVRLVVLDNGHGIPRENRERVFDLLFSTKGRRGTGFGLAITKKIVEEHGGRVSVESEFGHGTAFTIELPLREALPTASGERTEKVAVRQAG